MAKSTYAGYLTVPGDAGDPIVGSPNTGVGGDIVANFKAIGDVVQKKNSSGGVTIGYKDASNSVSGASCCIVSSASQAYGSKTVILGSDSAQSYISNSVNTMKNSDSSYVQGIAGWKGISGGSYPGSSYSTTDLGIEVNSTGYAVLDVEAIFVDTNYNRSAKKYRVVVDYSSYPSVISVSLLQGTDSFASSRFSVSNGSIYLENPDYQYSYFVLNIHYTMLTYAFSYNSGSYSGSYYGS